jgi:hypothetical protein
MPSERGRRSRWGVAPGQTRWRSPVRALGVALAAAAAPLALWGTSCALKGFENVEATPAKAPPTPDAGQDADPSPDASDDGSASCMPVTYPERVADTDSAVDKTFVVALRSLDLGEKQTLAEWQRGLDFDRKCTCTGEEGPSCKPLRAKVTHCDGPEGRDMGSSELFRSLSLLLASNGFGSEVYTDAIAQGEWTLLLRVRGYNGEKDDSQVELDWYFGANLGAAPSWSGDDLWPVASDSLNDVQGGGAHDLDSPRYQSRNAYVSDGRLVASFRDELQLSLGGGESATTITMRAATLLATLGTVPELPDRFVLTEGTIAGLWSEEEIFATLGSSPLICSNAQLYDFAKNAFCGALDIITRNAPPTEPCNALSLGLGFETYPARLGRIDVDKGGPPDMTPCAPGLDPANDSCAK